MRHGGVDIDRRHTLADSALHTHQTDAALVFHQLAHRADAAVAQVVDVVNFAAAVFQVNEDVEDFHDVVFAQNAYLVIRLEIQTRVHFHAANRRQVIAFEIKEQAAEQRIGRFQRRRLARTHDAVDIDQRIFAVAAFVGCHGVADIGTDVDVVDGQNIQRLEAEFLDFIEALVVELVTGFEADFASLLVHDVACDIGANQLFRLDEDFFQTLFFQLARLTGGDFGAGRHFHFAAFGVNEVVLQLHAAETLAHEGGFPAFFGFFVGNDVVEAVQDFFFGHALDFRHVNRFARFVLTFAVFRGLVAVERKKERRHRQFAAAVDTDVQDVFRVEFEIEPGTAVRNNARGKQVFARRVGFAAVVVEEHAGGAVHLRNDNALGTVHNESTVVGHERHIDHVHILLLDVADGAQAGIFVNVEGGQTQRDAQRCRVGHGALLAFFNVVFRLFQFVLHEVDFGAAGEIFNREYAGENLLQAFHQAAFRAHVALQEFLVGIALNFNQVRHFTNFGNLAEAAADAFAAGEAFAVSEGTDGFFCAHCVCARILFYVAQRNRREPPKPEADTNSTE